MYEYRNNPYPDSRLHADCCGHHILPVQAELRQYFMVALVDAARLQIPWASLWVRLTGTQHQSAFFRFRYGNRDTGDAFHPDSGSARRRTGREMVCRPCSSLPCICLLPGAFLEEGLRRRFLLCRQDYIIQLWKGIYDSSGSCNHICPLPYKCDDITCLSWGEYGLLSALLSVPHIWLYPGIPASWRQWIQWPDTTRRLVTMLRQ